VIISTYNRKDALARCLDSLFNQTYPKERFEIVVVDDGSDDGTSALAGTLLSKIRYFRQEHKGISAARNLGLKNAGKGIAAFIDDDCIPATDWIEQMARYHDIYPGAKVIQGSIGNFFSDNLWAVSMQSSIDAGLMRREKGDFIDWILTGNISFKKEVLERAGGFDEELKHCEDYDLAYKLKCKGEKIYYAPKIFVYHCHRVRLGEFVIQQFNFGRGRYRLDSKWKDKIIFQADHRQKFIFWSSTFSKAGFKFKLIFLFLAALIRKTAFSLGYVYERFFCFNSYTNP